MARGDDLVVAQLDEIEADGGDGDLELGAANVSTSRVSASCTFRTRASPRAI